MSMCVGRAGVGLVRGMRVTVIFIWVFVLGMCVFVSVDVFLDVYVCGESRGGVSEGYGGYWHHFGCHYRQPPPQGLGTESLGHVVVLRCTPPIWGAHHQCEMYTNNMSSTLTSETHSIATRYEYEFSEMPTTYIKSDLKENTIHNPHSAYRTSLKISSHICLLANSSGTTWHRRLAFKICAFWTHFLSENPVTLFICEFVIFNLQYLTLLRNIYICLLFLILNPVCPKSGPPLIGRPPLFLHHPSLQLVLIPRENSRMSFLDHILYIWDIRFKNIDHTVWGF